MSQIRFLCLTSSHAAPSPRARGRTVPRPRVLSHVPIRAVVSPQQKPCAIAQPVEHRVNESSAEVCVAAELLWRIALVGCRTPTTPTYKPSGWQGAARQSARSRAPLSGLGLDAAVTGSAEPRNSATSRQAGSPRGSVMRASHPAPAHARRTAGARTSRTPLPASRPSGARCPSCHPTVGTDPSAPTRSVPRDDEHGLRDFLRGQESASGHEARDVGVRGARRPRITAAHDGPGPSAVTRQQTPSPDDFFATR